ncbi:MAG: histidinol-phosphate transaminase [Trueperaceae bacterium]
MTLRDAVRDAPAYSFTAHAHRVKLDQNEAPDDLAPALKRRVTERLLDATWNRYPELRAGSVASAIAHRDDWNEEGVVVAPGSNVLIQAAVIAAGIGRTVVTVAPTFAVYAQQAQLLGARLHQVPLRGDDFALDVPALEAALQDGPGVLFLADPAAPTGQRLDDDALSAVLHAAERGGFLVVLDEAYWPYAGRHRLDLVRGRPDRLALRTFSKVDGLGGVRLGYALTDPDTARNLGKVLLPFDVSVLQATVATTVLADPDAVQARQRRIDTARSERGRVAATLTTLPGVQVHPSVTNFLLFRVADPAAVHRALLARGVLVRRQDHLPGLPGRLRVTIGTEQENDAFLAAVTAVVGDAEGATPHG